MVMLTTGETAAVGVGLDVGEGLITAAVGPGDRVPLGLTPATGGVPLEHATRPSATTITPALTWPSTVRSRFSLPRMLPHEIRRGAALRPDLLGPSPERQPPGAARRHVWKEGVPRGRPASPVKQDEPPANRQEARAAKRVWCIERYGRSREIVSGRSTNKLRSRCRS